MPTPRLARESPPRLSITDRRARAAVPAPLLVLAAIASVQIGAAIAKDLFATAGPSGTVLLRLGFAALVLALVARPSPSGTCRTILSCCTGPDMGSRWPTRIPTSSPSPTRSEPTITMTASRRSWSAGSDRAPSVEHRAAARTERGGARDVLELHTRLPKGARPVDQSYDHLGGLLVAEPVRRVDVGDAVAVGVRAPRPR